MEHKKTEKKKQNKKKPVCGSKKQYGQLSSKPEFVFSC